MSLLGLFDDVNFEYDDRGKCVDFINVYDGGSINGQLMQQICGRNFERLDYESSDNILTLRLVTNSNRVNVGFSAVFTTFSNGTTYSCNVTHAYNCMNGRCIPPSLQCNGDNNCGNNNDEFNCSGEDYDYDDNHDNDDDDDDDDDNDCDNTNIAVKEYNLATAEIVAIICGGFIGMVIITVVVFFVRDKNRKKSGNTTHAHSDLSLQPAIELGQPTQRGTVPPAYSALYLNRDQTMDVSIISVLPIE
ncbi:uncharacterized protein LOC102802401 [Saccoglossus kowalevskii]